MDRIRNSEQRRVRRLAYVGSGASIILALLGCAKNKNDGAEKVTPAPDRAPPSAQAAAQRKAILPVATGLAMGHGRACAVRSDGRVVCWGNNFAQQITMTEADSRQKVPERPTLVAGIDDAIQVAGSDDRWCARRMAGGVACWGGDLAARPEAGEVAVEISDGCMRTGTGAVHCAGKLVAGTGVVRALSRGAGHCVVDEERNVRCWGANNYHQLGDGTQVDRSSPVRVLGVSGAEEVGTSYFSESCARTSKGVFCWGGETNHPGDPREKPGIANAVQLAIGEYHACVLVQGGTLRCWGSNANNQLAADEEGSATAEIAFDKPIVAKGVVDVVEVAVGGGEPCGGCGSTCVRVKDGSVLCWGRINERRTPTRIDVGAATGQEK